MSEELEPATFDEHEERAFAAKGPWKWLFLGSVAIASVIGFYQWRDRSRQADLREEINTRYMVDIAPAAQRVDTFRQKLEGWIRQVGSDVPETRADPRLNLAGLHTASGVYLRLHADSITDAPLAIRDSAITMEPDAIPNCLGLNPVSLRGFYERIEFLQPIWIDDARAADTVLRLRVFLDELAIRQERDMPLLEEVARSDYFLLTIQHGENRREHPVDIYLWDLHSDELLLQSRIQARGTMIPIRVALGDTPYGRTRPLDQRAAMSDCSIASQVRAVAGDGMVEVRSAMPEGAIIERVEPGAEPAPAAAEEAEAAEGVEAPESEPSAESSETLD